MFAVLKIGARQYKVAEGDTLQVDLMTETAGSKVDLGNVMMVVDGTNAKVGTPVLQGAKVSAEVVGHGRSRKILVFKKKRRQNYRRRQGHRTDFTTIRITKIAA